MREKICKLVNHIRQNPDAPVKEKHPEYYGLACVVTDDMADVACSMELRHDYSVQEVSDLCGKPFDETYELLRQLEYLGITEGDIMDGVDKFRINIYVPGVFELMVANKALVDAHPEIARAFDEYTQIRTSKIAPNLERGMGFMRVIPVQQAVDGGQRVANHEEITFWLDKYSSSIAIASCQCRMTRRMAGEGSGSLEDEKCIILGPTAESVIRTGRARRITKDEALEICKRCEEEGCVHQITNIDGDDKIFAICNCHYGSCFALRISQMFNCPNGSNSNFVATVNKDNCVACGQCVEVCPANAVKLSRKLCAETPILYPKLLLPDDNEWTRDNWNNEYRTDHKYVWEGGTAPCKVTCPAHIAVQGYIKLASQGKMMEALELIKKDNPFPAICGRICPHNCESECSRGDIDEPVAIDDIKRYIADWELNEGTRYIPKKIRDFHDRKIAVIGSGPAGLSCAYYLSINNYDVTVFEKEEKLGGMMTLGIPSFRLEKDVVEAEIDVLRQMGVKFKTNCEVGKDILIPRLRQEGFKGFYIAIGAQGGRKLNIEGEDAEGVIAGIDFLKNINLGKGKELDGNVVVIGGGNVAIDVARSAIRQGAGTTTMFCLESEAEMPALPEEIEEARAEGISFDNGWGPNRIVVENGKVTGVEFKKCTSVFEDGKFSPKYDVCQMKTVPADHVIMSVGQSIEWGGIRTYDVNLELGRGNTAVADPVTYQTTEPDIFVGGDVYTGPKFAIDAIAAGKQAAESLHRYAQDGQSLVFGRMVPEYEALDKKNFDKEAVKSTGFDDAPRQKPFHKAENEKTYNDTRRALTEIQMKAEAARCLGCGVSYVDPDKCIGCGLCTTRCKFDAIHLEKKYDSPLSLHEETPMLAMARYAAREEAIAAKAAKEAE